LDKGEVFAVSNALMPATPKVLQVFFGAGLALRFDGAVVHLERD
jgi:hypothetical protein